MKNELSFYGKLYFGLAIVVCVGIVLFFNTKNKELFVIICYAMPCLIIICFIVLYLDQKESEKDELKKYELLQELNKTSQESNYVDVEVIDEKPKPTSKAMTIYETPYQPNQTQRAVTIYKKSYQPSIYKKPDKLRNHADYTYKPHNSRKPTMKQIQACRKIAKQKGLWLPHNYDSDWEIASGFISKFGDYA